MPEVKSTFYAWFNELKPATQATLLLALLAAIIILEIILPWWVVATTILPISVGFLWWLFFIAFTELAKFKKPK